MPRMKWTPALILLHIVVYAFAALFVAPFLMSLLLSLKSQPETAQSLLGLPTRLHFENFALAMEKAKILQSFRNSLIVTACSVALTTISSAMAGYAIGRGYGKKPLRAYELLLLASMMVPFQTLMIPLYKMYKAANLMNSLLGVILSISGLSLAFSIMMYIGFVKTIPLELEEAAWLEGYGRFRIFLKIVFPLLMPITFTVATLNTLWNWNEFGISFIVLQKDAVKTIPMQQYVFFSQYTANFNLAFAAAVITMVPVVLFFILAQKYIVAGLTEGAVKG